jgi:hypothetical protein
MDEFMMGRESLLGNRFASDDQAAVGESWLRDIGGQQG